MERLEVSCAVRRLYRSLGVKVLRRSYIVKVKFFLCTSLLTSALDEGDWLALRPGSSYAAHFLGNCSWYPLSKKSYEPQIQF